MRAPNQKYSGTYTDVQWSIIAQAVRAGVDLDADRTTMPGDQLTYTTGCEADPPDGMTLNGVMLRTVIQRIIWFTLCRPGLSEQSPKVLHRLRKQTDNLRRALLKEFPQQYWSDALRDAPAILAELSRDLTFQIDHTSDRRRLNAYDDARNHMLVELLELWITLGGKPTGRATERFLQACTEPAFGRRKSGTKGIFHWLDRYRKGDVYFHH